MESIPVDKSAFRILVVDDEPDWRRSNQKVLQRAGYTVETAADAAEALARTRAAPFHLAVLDVNLPDMSGDDLVAEVRAIQPQTLVIMLTGFATTEHAARARAHGSVDVLEKIGDQTDDADLADDLVARVDELFAEAAGNRA